ncbi:MAG: hypothetical protein JNM17_06715 [Archangium sp.]|nr:hypothetical protein [Archangium sp.]
MKKTHEYRVEAVAGLTLAQEHDMTRAATAAWNAAYETTEGTQMQACVNANRALHEFYRLCAEGRS